MAEAGPEGFTVRVLGPDGRPGGLGALVGDRHVITCAHVVNSALGLDQRSQGKPDGTVTIEFPLLASASTGPLAASTRRLTAIVTVWRPPPPAMGMAGDDIAGLVIDGDLPDGTRPGGLAADSPQPGTGVRVFGYLPQRPEGALVAAIIRGPVANGRLQLDSAADSALSVRPGFSGSPVFDDSIGRIAGLISQAGEAKSATTDSLAVGPALLRDAWPEVLAGSARSRSRTEVTVLHVSGMRFRGPADEDSTLLPLLRRDLSELADKDGLRPDVLVVTGDLADRGLPAEYRGAFDFLARLAGAAGIPRRHIAIVPGSAHPSARAIRTWFNTPAPPVTTPGGRSSR